MPFPARKKKFLLIASLVFSLLLLLGTLVYRYFFHSSPLPVLHLVAPPAQQASLLEHQALQAPPALSIQTGNVIPRLTYQEMVNNETTKDDVSVDDLDGKDDEVDQVEDVSNIADEHSLPEQAKNALSDLLDATEQARHINEQFSHTVQAGDTLSKILDDSGLDDNIGASLIKQFPAFHTQLRVGQKIYWTLNNDGKLMYLNWLISNREERVYIRTANNTFTRQIIKQQSEWRHQILQGQIDHSFGKSFQDLGLNHTTANQATNALQWQTNMRHLRKGDRFAVDISREFVNGQPTGRAEINAIHLRTGNTHFYAIKASNGSFYDENGQSTGKGFNRYPFNFKPRVSSPFNLRRRHPVTGVIRPHRGVDFAVPINTKIIAPADGVVQKVAFQAHGAGRYIIIRHSRKYQTVYMHLHRALVKAGEKVKRGQAIALSGNSGISTGPHLHYEFRIDGQPWNPLSVSLPNVVNLMSDKEHKAFLAKAKQMKQALTLKE